MGCGASAEATGPVRVHVRHVYDGGDDAASADDDYTPLSPAELRMYDELNDAATGTSTADATTEPSEFSTTIRITYRVVKARVLHGVDGDVDTAEDPDESHLNAPASPGFFQSDSSPELYYSRGRAGAGGTHRPSNRYGAVNPVSLKPPFGDLKPADVARIREWCGRVYAAWDGKPFDEVPDRYITPPVSSGNVSMTDLRSSDSRSHRSLDMSPSTSSVSSPAFLCGVGTSDYAAFESKASSSAGALPPMSSSDAAGLSQQPLIGTPPLSSGRRRRFSIDDGDPLMAPDPIVRQGLLGRNRKETY